MNKRQTIGWLAVPTCLAFASLALAGGHSGGVTGDAKAGEKVFKSQCTRCHTIDEGGKDKVGPNLFGVFGGTAGVRAASFGKRHSKAMKASGVVWNEETLEGFLANPKKFMPKNWQNPSNWNACAPIWINNLNR